MIEPCVLCGEPAVFLDEAQRPLEADRPWCAEHEKAHPHPGEGFTRIRLTDSRIPKNAR